MTWNNIQKLHRHDVFTYGEVCKYQRMQGGPDLSEARDGGNGKGWGGGGAGDEGDDEGGR